MQRVFQTCLMLFVLLMQTAPLMAVRAPKEESCVMTCCAWLAEAGLSGCGCEARPAKDEGPQPAQLPPPSSSSGRDFTPSTLWTEQRPDLSFFTFPAKEAGRTTRPAADEHAATMPHVRLTVLFCSLLT